MTVARWLASLRFQLSVAMMTALLFLACLMLPAVQLNARPLPTDSIALLTVGWGGLISGQCTWLANPAMIAGVVLLWRGHVILPPLASLAALALIGWAATQGTPMPEPRGGMQTVSTYLAGYWLWVTSAAVLLTGSSLRWLASRAVPLEGGRRPAGRSKLQ